MRRIDILNAYGSWYRGRNGVAVTFVANQDWSKQTFEDRLRLFHKTVDRRRLGGRFYEERYRHSRLDFMVSPEMFDAGHPHYHGFLAIPPDDISKFGKEGAMRLYEATWKMLAPSGSMLCVELRDLKPDEDDGWASYCSKENSLFACPDAVWSLEDFLRHPD